MKEEDEKHSDYHILIGHMKVCTLKDDHIKLVNELVQAKKSPFIPSNMLNDMFVME